MEKQTIKIVQCPIYNLSIPVTSIPSLTFNACIHVLIGDHEEEGVISFTPEVIDYENVVYMGLPIADGYHAFKAFVSNFLNMGIDMSALMTKASDEVMNKYVTRDKFQWAIDLIATPKTLEIE